MKTYTFCCTNCEKEFVDDGDLIKVVESEDTTGDREVINACPHCLTDGYLMDYLQNGDN